MNRDFIIKHWYASVYEQFENQVHDVEFLIRTLGELTGGAPQRILEAACGGGRICVPLARAGHDVVGFDADEHMLLRCYRRMAGLPNIRCYQADAIATDWGANFDAVVLAGNILINIESDIDYAQAQQLFIRMAASALRDGGLLFLDFDLHGNPETFFNQLGESSYFEGADELGTVGRTVSCGSAFDPVTRLCAGVSHIEVTANNGERIVLPKHWHKHIPTQAQVCSWLRDAGLSIERTHRDYTAEPLPEPIADYCRASIWARKS